MQLSHAGDPVGVPQEEVPVAVLPEDGPPASTPPDIGAGTVVAGPVAALPGVPAPRHELPGGGRPGFVPRTRSRPAQPDTVVFTAPCPACGVDARWSEEREDTRLHAAVECPCG